MEEGAGAGGWSPEIDGPGARTPWERADASLPSDLFRSWIHCMTEPVDFFRSLAPAAPFSRPLLFFFVFWILGSGLGSLSASATMGDWYAEAGIAKPDVAWSLFLFFLSPFLGALSLGLYIGLTHLGVRLFVRDAGPIGLTARGLCYVSAPQLVAVVPFVGWLVAPLWSLFLAVIAIREVHETTTGTSVAAVIVPPVVLWFGFAMLIGFLVFFVVIAAGGA